MDIAEIFAKDLRGHAYIEARGLSPKAVRERPHTCETCKQAEMLPVVQQIVNNWPIPNRFRRIK